MLFDISVDEELRAVVSRPTGIVEPHTMRAAVSDVAAFSGFEPGMDQLLDLSEGGIQLDGTEAQKLAEFFQSTEVREKLGSGYRLAVVAPEPSDFGSARMFEMYDVEDSVAIRVFYSLDEAYAWLRDSSS